VRRDPQRVVNTDHVAFGLAFGPRCTHLDYYHG
jgi:hypothetical protein